MQIGESDNLIITGFMGTGKSSVGRRVARDLGLPFLDMDNEIERRTGKSIPAIFAEQGELAFRKMEAKLCQELSARRGWVIATGGGALVDPANRKTMMESGSVICLTGSTDEIMSRLRIGRDAGKTGPSDRPLLNTANPEDEIERLLAIRRSAYAAIPWQIDTSHLSVEEVAQRVIELAGTISLSIQALGSDYNIHIGDKLLDQAGNLLRAVGVPEESRVALVSNPVVMPLYGARVERSLRSAGLQSFTCSIPDGEKFKSLDTVATLYDQFLAAGMDRGGTVLALGGGVTGDIAGFAATSFLRGVRFAQVPTTLLAMVDASVGGKTGVDLPQGKNLVGAFKQPVVVLIDPSVLATLPTEELRSGMVETLKHGVIADPELFEALSLEPGRIPTNRELARALQVKIDVVEQDPLERGRRAVLNLGHTAGHALERLSHFVLRHGEAVGVGMVAAARIAVEMGHASPSLTNQLASSLDAWNLPSTCPPYSAEAIWEAMSYDKKRQNKRLRWVLPHALGRVEINDQVPKELVISVLRQMGAEE